MMNDGPYIAEAAALIGDPARANMLLALMDGRALTATELALAAGWRRPPPAVTWHGSSRGGCFRSSRADGIAITGLPPPASRRCSKG